MVQIKDTVDFVLTLKQIEEALKKSGRPEASEAKRLRQKFQNLCPHSRADRDGNKPVGECPECLKRFSSTKTPN
jgi:hypothetical protein